MEELQNKELSFDEYLRGIQDQELKSILLKLKNEMRKPGVTWETVREVLNSLLNKDIETFHNVVSLIVRK